MSQSPDRSLRSATNSWKGPGGFGYAVPVDPIPASQRTGLYQISYFTHRIADEIALAFVTGGGSAATKAGKARNALRWIDAAGNLVTAVRGAHDMQENGADFWNTLQLVGGTAGFGVHVATWGHKLRLDPDTISGARTGAFPGGINFRSADDALIRSQDGIPTRLFHYTDESAAARIHASEELFPSLRSVNPKDVRYGDGQYLTDIAPGSKTPAQLSRALIGNPFQGRRFTHFVEIDVSGLHVLRGRKGIFVIPNTRPLDLAGRILRIGPN